MEHFAAKGVIHAIRDTEFGAIAIFETRSEEFIEVRFEADTPELARARQIHADRLGIELFLLRDTPAEARIFAIP